MFSVWRIVIGSGVGVEKGKPIQGSKGYVSELRCLTLRLLSQLSFAKVKLKFTLPRDVNCPQLFAQNNMRPVMDRYKSLLLSSQGSDHTPRYDNTANSVEE